MNSWHMWPSWLQMHLMWCVLTLCYVWYNLYFLSAVSLYDVFLFVFVQLCIYCSTTAVIPSKGSIKSLLIIRVIVTWVHKFSCIWDASSTENTKPRGRHFDFFYIILIRNDWMSDWIKENILHSTWCVKYDSRWDEIMSLVRKSLVLWLVGSFSDRGASARTAAAGRIPRRVQMLVLVDGSRQTEWWNDAKQQHEWTRGRTHSYSKRQQWDDRPTAKVCRWSITLFTDVSGCLRMFKDVSGSLMMFRYVSGWLQMFQDVYGCFRLFAVVSEWFRIFKDVSGCFRLFKDVSRCLRMFKNVSGCFRLFEDV